MSKSSGICIAHFFYDVDAGIDNDLFYLFISILQNAAYSTEILKETQRRCIQEVHEERVGDTISGLGESRRALRQRARMCEGISRRDIAMIIERWTRSIQMMR